MYPSFSALKAGSGPPDQGNPPPPVPWDRAPPPPWSLPQIPFPDDFEQLVVRQVDVQRCDRDVPVFQRLEVRIGTTGPGHPPSADPVDLAPPRVFHRGDFLVKDSTPQIRDLHAFYLIAWDRWQIDIEQCFAGK